MIRHIVLFSTKDPGNAATIKEELEKMAAIPGVQRFDVAYNTKRDRFSKEIDVVLYSEFATWSDLDAYQTHPAYHQATEIVRPLRDQRIVVDYEV
ncbi:MAG: Dabb family protein [Rhodospirillaceae bacterium]|nr:Dabb family protein [Rhodospirillaceae bacterium]